MDTGIMLNLLSTLGQLRKRDRWTRPQVDAYQAEPLRRLREYAYARSPFYQRFHEGCSTAPCGSCPSSPRLC